MYLEYIVKDNKYENINQILKQEFHISTRLMSKLIINKHIFQNDVIADSRNLVKYNDNIKVNLDFEEESENIISAPIPIDIIFEDDCFLILNKPAGIAVHPSVLHYKDSLSNAVKFYFEKIRTTKKNSSC